MSNNQISKVLTGAIVSALLSSGAVFAQDSSSKTTGSDPVVTEKNKCKGHSKTDKNACGGSNGCGQKDSKKDKNACGSSNGCGQKDSKKDSKKETKTDKNACGGPNGCGQKK